MSGDDLQKTVEIVQSSWQKIVWIRRLKSLPISFFVGELQKRLRFDARRAQTQRTWSPRDAPKPKKAPPRRNRDRRDPRGPRASDVGLSQDPHSQLAARDDRAFPRRSTRA